MRESMGTMFRKIFLYGNSGQTVPRRSKTLISNRGRRSLLH